MAAVTQNITAEQGAALSVTLTGAVASLNGRTLRMHVRAKVGDTTTKLVASTTDGRLTVGANPYTTASLSIGADVMAAVSVTAATEYWVYDVESYTSAADVRREWQGRFTITRDVTRDTEATTEDALAGLVRYDSPQSLTDAQKLQARENIGAGTGGGGGSGDVVGPAGATDDRITAFDGTTGKLIKQGSVTATAVASHLSSTSNPHSVTAAQVGADPAGTASTAVSTHAGAVDPHGDRAYADGLAGNYATAAQGALADSAVQDVAAEIHAATAASLADDDEQGFWQSASSAMRKITWANVKATLKAYFDTLYAAITHAHAASDITSGTLDAARLPTPTTTALGGVKRNTGSAGQYVTGIDTDGSLLRDTPAGGGGTKTIAVFIPNQNQPPASGFATLDTRNSVLMLDFDDASVESAVFCGVIPEAASLTSGLVVSIRWAATSATTGNVRWRAEFEADGTDLDSDSFATATEATGAANGTNGNETTTEITCTTIDSLAAGDRYRLKVSRVGNDGTNDTMSGDAELVAVELRAA